MDKICGILFSAGAITLLAHATVCSYVTPFRVGVHFDSSEAIGVPTVLADGDNWSAIENAYKAPTTTGEGIGTMGFWLAYWQVVC